MSMQNIQKSKLHFDTATAENYLQVTDESISKEIFNLHYHKQYDLLETFPRPEKEKLGDYYKSENYISHTDSRRNFFEKLYQSVKNKTLSDKIRLINKNHSPSSVKIKVLDIGCGTGDFLAAIKKNTVWETVGVEPNQQAADLARNKNVKVFEHVEKLREQEFDVITLWHVLEHVPNLEYYIQQVQQLLKNNGLLIVAVPNYKSYDAKHYGTKWAAYDVPRHIWHFSKKAIKRIFETYDFKLIHIKPMYYDSFYVSLLSEKYKTGRMNFIKGFYYGFISNLSGFFTKEYSSHIYLIKKVHKRT